MERCSELVLCGAMSSTGKCEKKRIWFFQVDLLFRLIRLIWGSRSIHVAYNRDPSTSRTGLRLTESRDRTSVRKNYEKLFRLKKG